MHSLLKLHFSIFTCFISLACVSSETHNLQRVFRRGGGSPLYRLYGYVQRQRVCFFFCQFGLLLLPQLLRGENDSKQSDEFQASLVWNRVLFVLSRTHPIFWKYPPECLVEFRTQKGGHCARRYLRRPWKLGLRSVAWSKQRMFCKESLGKIKFRAFPKRVGPRILSLESVDYFGTSEHYRVVEKKKGILHVSSMQNGDGWVLKTFTVRKWVLWWVCDLFSVMIEMTLPCKSRFWYLIMM